MKMTSVSAMIWGSVCGVLSAQAPSAQTENAARMAAGAAPIYRVSVTARTTKAISYQHRSGATRIDFRGTDLLPLSHAEAKVESKQGRIAIEVEFRNLEPATKFGAEYLTYVLWAITPEGRPANLGEILLNGTSSKLDVTTELQVFGLVVTAEPYFAVTMPSDLIVMENEVRADTRGKIELIDAKYELLKRGEYEHLANPLELKVDRRQPLELYEARNAVHIARAIGAGQFATETFEKAEDNLKQAEAYQARKAGAKPVAMTARQAVQTAEDARAIAVKRQEDDSVANEKQQGLEREARADSDREAAQSETARVTRDAKSAEIAARENSERLTREKNAQAEAALTEADRIRRENDARMAASGIEADRLKRENDARMAATGLEADRLRHENEARLATSDAEADRLKRENAEQRAANQADLDRAAKDKAQAETEKSDLRAQLLTQFNVILQTRYTVRGWIVNMDDVLFDTAKFSLRPLAREKLAKVAGIVSGHPGLRLDVEGHTDSVGGDDYNQQLSEQRGATVRDYLTGQGMATGSVTSKGFGKTQPVASNETAQGRQQNRRVELVISGEIIGTTIGAPVAAR